MKDELDLWLRLKYWKTGEWQVCEDILRQYDKEGKAWCPGKEKLFRALELCPMDKVKVLILGQDPYTDRDLATGVAFDIGKSPVYPPTIRAMLSELKADLDIPHTGNLQGWAEQGVLLWNVVPSNDGKTSLSDNIPEWTLLTKEILEVCNARNAVLVGLGGFARKAIDAWSDPEKSDVLYWDHPSPAARNGARPFLGSRMYSTINDHLSQIGMTPIDWRL